MYSDNIKYIVEIIGTFFFLSVILNSSNENLIKPFGIALTLLAAIFFAGKISGAHLNPAVTLAVYLKDSMPINVVFGYIVAQLIGAGLAVKFNNYILQNNI
jgi:aquaporin Z